MKKRVATIMMCAATVSMAAQFPYKAVVSVPVADLVGEPIGQAYHTMPWSCYRSQYESNKRIHQILLHEIVDVLDQKGEELHIQIPNSYYITPASRQPNRCYWTHQSNLIPLSSTAAPYLPCQQMSDQKRNTFALLLPWKDPQSGVTFSGGTRFIEKGGAIENFKTLYYINQHTQRLDSVTIPSSCLYQANKKSYREKLRDFIQIIRSWAHKDIPYVLGGCSYTISTDDTYIVQKSTFNGSELSYYDRPGIKQRVKTGLDCTGLITRAAHIVGLPYHYKNTTTLLDRLEPLKKGDTIAEGDLIWFPGHVIIVSDMKNNKVIEACSYGGGYGKVHEKPLHALFQGINSYRDLVDACCENKRLIRLNKKGYPYRTYDTFKILKFASLWKLPRQQE